MYGCVYSIWTCSQLDREKKKECFKLQYEPLSPAKGRAGNGFGTQTLVHSNKTAGTVQPTTPFRYPLIFSARNNTMFENFFKKKVKNLFKKVTLQNILLWKQSNFCKLFFGKKRRETTRFDPVKVDVRNLGISAANSFILLLPISLGVSWL